MIGIFLLLFHLLVGLLVTQPASTADLRLTEVYYNTPGKDSEEEWIEIANLGKEAISLSDYKVGDEESIWGGEGMFRFPADALIAPGQMIVIAQTATGFRALYGRDPDYEIVETIPQVPDMRRYALWSNGDLALANDGDELLLLNGENQIVDSLNYGDKVTYFAPAIANVYTGQSIERVPSTCDTDTAADWQPQRFPTPGQAQFEGECLTESGMPMASSNLLKIGEIQGGGDISPYVNQIVEFHGVVTGSYEDQNEAGIVFYTLFVQDLPGEEDGDPATSDGIAVFLELDRPRYKPGDIIQIKGVVTEFYGLTEIDNDGLEITLIDSDGALPLPLAIDLPDENQAIPAYFEALEASLVSLPGLVQVVGPTHAGCGFAVAQPKFVQQVTPVRSESDFPQHVISVLHPSDVECRDIVQVKITDQLMGLAGPLIYHFDQFKIVQQEMGKVEVLPAEWPQVPMAFSPSETQFTVATFNLENHFDDERHMNGSAEPVIDSEELLVKQQKLARTITASLACPTIVAVQEVENLGLLKDLVKLTQETCGFTYQVSHHESADSRGLDVALLSDPRLVQITSVRLRQGCTKIETGVEDPGVSCPANENPLFGRPPLQVDASIDGELYTFFVNHFKSKRGGALETQDRRLEQAAHVLDLVSEISAREPQKKIIVLGDMNDYELSPTLLRLQEGNVLYNILQSVPIVERYSFIFDGSPQLIDTILISRSLESRVTQAVILHINAPYPDELAHDMTAAGIAFRSSDHDIPLIYINREIDSVSRTTVQPSPMPTKNGISSIAQTATPVVDARKNMQEMTKGNLLLVGAVLLIIFTGSLVFIIKRIA